MERFTIISIFLLCAPGLCASLKIGAFNVQVFGQTKFSNSDVVSILGQIVLRYDLILVQEIRDSSETIIYSFLTELNDLTADGVVYNLEVSERLGRTTSREQYAFIYRKDLVHMSAGYSSTMRKGTAFYFHREDTVEILDTLQYNDTVDDTFEREPYMILVQTILEDLPDFFLVGIHIRPDDAFSEINALSTVYDEAVSYFKTENGIILGDLNADCTYLSMASYYTLSLVTDKRFTWSLQPMDTTTTSTICAYDRIVLAGEIADLVVDGSASVFRFDQEYGLTVEQALDVSDHYPVEIKLQFKAISSQFPSIAYTATTLRQGEAVCSAEEQRLQATTTINQQVRALIQNLTGSDS